MSNLQLNQVSISALATLSDNNRHLTRVVSFVDGHQKILGCLLPAEDVEYAFTLGSSAERIEITQGECDVRIITQDGNESNEYFREGQSFVVGAGGRFFVSCSDVVQYVRHFEG